MASHVLPFLTFLATAFRIAVSLAGAGAKTPIIDAAADAIFREANDLVVDTASMTDVHAGFTPRPGALHDFETANGVQHTNYFRQTPALDFLRQSFGF